MGRIDFWNVPDEFTDYEWAVLLAQHSVRPWGQERDDVRSAWIGTHAIASQSAKELSADELKELFESLCCYLKTQQKQERILSPEQAASLARL